MAGEDVGDNFDRVLFLGCSSNTALPDSKKLIRQMVGRLVTCVRVGEGEGGSLQLHS